MQLLSFKSEFPESTAKGRTGVAVPFTIARTWKQPKCPSAEDWIMTVRCIDTMECYSAINRNKAGSFAETWMDFETVIQNETGHKEKNKYHTLMHRCGV